MATIIDFSLAGARAGARETRRAQPGSAEIVIFPGVRYERYEAAPAAAAERRPSRKRRRMELED